jgi:HK97 family phage portal protein
MARFAGGMMETSSGKSVSPDTALQLSVVWACVRLISQTIATLPAMVYRGDGANNRVVAADHPLYSLLHDQPNAEMTAVEFWETMVACVLMTGNGYARKDYNGVGDVISLWPMAPDRMTVRRMPDGSLRYTFSPHYGATEEFDEDQLFHIKGWSTNGMVGLSPIAYARNSLGTAIAAEEAAGKFFANGLSASGFIQTGGVVLNKEQRDRFKATLREFQGSGNAGKTMLLEGPFTYNQLSITPDDAQLLATRQHSVEDICRWFDVDPSLIGQSSSRIASSALEQQMLRFLTLTLRPWLSRIESRVRASIVKPGDRGSVNFEFNVEGLLRADSAGRAALYAVYAQNGLATRNEIRRRENMPTMDGGDVLTVQSNLVPLDQLGQQPAGQTPDGFGHFPKPQDPVSAQQPVRQ